MVEVTIDAGSGFCFGVVNAIESAERELKHADELYCLGDLVHNSLEMERLQTLGLRTIRHEALRQLTGRTVLLRAHGEPPSTYQLAQQHRIKIIDATCPVVLQLQRRIHRCFLETKDSGAQLVIYG
ncbi:MAG: 4-hydroxy-3-methylbut-2-enyl diphosphate reductase, partial [Tannerella sp.]|nr:4-hydroxy-3-methylbut-2-enyl diphosphate reductase [Tannerella sp.]